MLYDGLLDLLKSGFVYVSYLHDYLQAPEMPRRAGHKTLHPWPHYAFNARIRGDFQRDVAKTQSLGFRFSCTAPAN